MSEEVVPELPATTDNRFVVACIIFEFLMVILYITCTNYGDAATATSGVVSTDIDTYYPMFQDVNVMIFIGFGFLMTFLRKYGFSSVGYNFLISTFAIQWAMINNGFWHTVASNWNNDWHGWSTIKLSLTSLITGNFAAGAVLISFGAVLGKTSPLQMLVVVIFELIVYAINESIGAVHLSAVDMGGSIFVHTFGAFFGMALSWTISRPRYNQVGDFYNHNEEVGKILPRSKNGSTPTSDMFAMVGTLFLWMFWPSFNGALASGDQQVRVVINTVLALCGSCVAAYATISIMRKNGKFDMVSIQNATLAGGVAVGSSSDLVIQPGGAIVVGLVAGIVSVFGYEKISPYLASKIGLDDTCGVANLHGWPGIIGALGGSISASIADTSVYGENIGRVFPMRAPSNVTEAASYGVAPGEDRTASGQAAIQFYALIITLAMSISGGIVCGLIIKAPFLLPGRDEDKAPWLKIGYSTDDRLWYDDETAWAEEEDEAVVEERERIEAIAAEKRTVDQAIQVLQKQQEQLEKFLDTKDIEMGDMKTDEKSEEKSDSNE